MQLFLHTVLSNVSVAHISFYYILAQVKSFVRIFVWFGKMQGTLVWALLIKICLIVSSIFTAGVWSCPATTGERPPPCSGHTFTAVDDRRAVVFGGKNGEQGRMNDVYIIDFSTMVFKQHVGTMQIKNLKLCPYILVKLHCHTPLVGW